MNAYHAQLEYNYQIWQHRLNLAFNAWMRGARVGAAAL